VPPPSFHVLTRQGDATHEVDFALRDLGTSPEEAGLHRYFFVTRANQTVVMARAAHVPIAHALRERGWDEPGRTT
jgi:hypothetical protein